MAQYAPVTVTILDAPDRAAFDAAKSVLMPYAPHRRREAGAAGMNQSVELWAERGSGSGIADDLEPTGCTFEVVQGAARGRNGTMSRYHPVLGMHHVEIDARGHKVASPEQWTAFADLDAHPEGAHEAIRNYFGTAWDREFVKLRARVEPGSRPQAAAPAGRFGDAAGTERDEYALF